MQCNQCAIELSDGDLFISYSLMELLEETDERYAQEPVCPSRLSGNLCIDCFER